MNCCQLRDNDDRQVTGAELDRGLLFVVKLFLFLDFHLVHWWCRIFTLQVELRY